MGKLSRIVRRGWIAAIGAASLAASPAMAQIQNVDPNTAIDAEYERIRDFLILHYHATTRDNSPFWNHVRTMPVPDTLRHQIDLWRESAHVARYGFGLFRPPSWIAVFVGQGILPDGWDPRADRVDAAALSRALAAARNDVAARVAAMPDPNLAEPPPGHWRLAVSH